MGCRHTQNICMITETVLARTRPGIEDFSYGDHAGWVGILRGGNKVRKDVTETWNVPVADLAG